MNYLATKSAYSTITEDIHPPRPTPTPTLTPTATPTLTPSPTSTPAVWQPGQTAQDAADTLTGIGRFLVEGLLWIGIVLVPLVGLPAGIIVLVVRAVRRGKKAGAKE